MFRGIPPRSVTQHILASKQHAVGLEGFWGLSVILLSMPALHYFFAVKSPYFDIPRGWHQIVDHPLVLCLSIAICFSIAAFNLCGLGVTKAVSASARSVASSASRSIEP